MIDRTETQITIGETLAISQELAQPGGLIDKLAFLDRRLTRLANKLANDLAKA